MSESLDTTMTQLAALLTDAARLSAPYDVHIQTLEVQKADALADLNWQIENLKATVKMAVLEHQGTVKKDGITASYVHKETWDSDQLNAMAVEIPAIRQCLRDASYVAIRFKATPRKAEA